MVDRFHPGTVRAKFKQAWKGVSQTLWTLIASHDS